MYYLLVRSTIWLLARITLSLSGGMRIYGANGIPRRGGVIVAPNHLSHVDPAFVGVSVKRFAYFMATDELFAIRYIGRITKWLRAFPIRQDSPDRGALRKSEKILKSGNALIVFPEGHESVTGELRPLQAGVVMLALRAGVPIVPAGISGTSRMMQPRSFRLHKAPSPAIVIYGDPISPDELAGGLKGRAAIDHGIVVVETAIRTLLADSRHGDDAVPFVHPDISYKAN